MNSNNQLLHLVNDIVSDINIADEGDVTKNLNILLAHSISLIKNENTDVVQSGLRSIDSVIDRLWEYINIGKWSDVSLSYRNLYSRASIFKALGLLKSSEGSANVMEALRIIDMGLLMGAAYDKELSKIATLLCQQIELKDNKDLETSFISDVKVKWKCFSSSESIKCLPCPTLETFYKEFFSIRRPLKIIDSIKHWPALTRWPSVHYIVKKIGARTVPVEIGSHYVSTDWSQKLMTVSEFIRRYIFDVDKESVVGYLAQHQLFNQIPELLEDIRVPDYCCVREKADASSPDMNIWFGPEGTITPLHYDYKHNILAQVVGSKRIILFDPKWSENMYPHEDQLLFNTSRVDAENVEHNKFPLFSKAEAIECFLDAGDMLYIPPNWWHHVRSFSSSFSVSFWWE